jgi:hypothetical protein
MGTPQAKSWRAGYHDGAEARHFDGAHRHGPSAVHWSVQG